MPDLFELNQKARIAILLTIVGITLAITAIALTAAGVVTEIDFFKNSVLITSKQGYGATEGSGISITATEVSKRIDYTYAIADSGVDEPKLDVFGTPTTNQCLTFAPTGANDFQWQDCAIDMTFKTFATPSGTNPEADTSTDTLTFTEQPGLDIVGDSSTDTIDFAFDPTELVNIIWSNGSSFNWTFDSGTIDPQIVFSENSIGITGNVTLADDLSVTGLVSCDTIDTNGSGLLSCGVDDDIPESVDYSNLIGGVGIDNSPLGTLSFDSTELSNLTWNTGTSFTWTFDAGTTDPQFTFANNSITIVGNTSISAIVNCDTIDTDGTGLLSCGVDDDIPESIDYSNLIGGTGIDNNPLGTLVFDSTELTNLTWGNGSTFTWTFDTTSSASDPSFTFTDIETAYNDTPVDTDLRFESINRPDMFHLDAARDRIYIGQFDGDPSIQVEGFNGVGNVDLQIMAPADPGLVLASNTPNDPNAGSIYLGRIGGDSSLSEWSRIRYNGSANELQLDRNFAGDIVLNSNQVASVNTRIQSASNTEALVVNGDENVVNIGLDTQRITLGLSGTVRAQVVDSTSASLAVLTTTSNACCSRIGIGTQVGPQMNEGLILTYDANSNTSLIGSTITNSQFSFHRDAGPILSVNTNGVFTWGKGSALTWIFNSGTVVPSFVFGEDSLTINGNTTLADSLTLQASVNCDTIDTDANGLVSCGVDDDIPETADYTNLIGGNGIDNSPTGTLVFNSVELSDLTWNSGALFAWTFDSGTIDPQIVFGENSIGITGNVTLADSLNVVGLVSCDTIDTDTSGLMSCGTDADTITSVEEDDTQKVATLNVLDFGSGFDIVESPSNEANISFDSTELSTLTWGSGSSFTWTFDATSSASDPSLTFSADKISLDDTDIFSLRNSIQLRQATADYSLIWNDPSADRILTLPAVSQDSTFAFLEEAQTFTTKQTFSSVISVTDTTDSTSSATGSAVFSGGIAVAKNVTLNGQINQSRSIRRHFSKTSSVDNAVVNVFSVTTPTNAANMGGSWTAELIINVDHSTGNAGGAGSNMGLIALVTNRSNHVDSTQTASVVEVKQSANNDESGGARTIIDISVNVDTSNSNEVDVGLIVDMGPTTGNIWTADIDVELTWNTYLAAPVLSGL
jgi:hypothetical protein